MKKATITIGISASGKSTHAAQQVEYGRKIGEPVFEINRDMYRVAILKEKGKEFQWKAWNWKWEKEVTDRVNVDIQYCADAEYDIIISDTNLNTDRRNQLIKKLEDLGYEVEIKEFPITIEEAWARDSARLNGVGHSVIAEQYDNWLKYLKEKGKHRTYTCLPVNEMRTAIIVDVDGTLASMDGKRGPFEWAKVSGDTVHEHVKMIVNSLWHDTTVIILSGRDGVCYEDTKQWLLYNGIKFDFLFMRQAGDMRKDAEIKEEIFWEHIAPKYNVICAIDDRPVMIRKWQSIGIKTLACGNQAIEF